jgi:Flp pilus assembly protein TadG
MLKKPHSKSKRKSPAQAMVEFALALPVLLLVVYGLIEAGRLIFIYASVVTAARQAVRYGSATGTNAGGQYYYQDCTGIDDAANNIGFINSFSDIQINYDSLDASGNSVALNGITLSTRCEQVTTGQWTSMDIPDSNNSDRIVVTVSAQYTPIVPIVPFGSYTITSQAARTILSSVSIEVTAAPQGWNPCSSGCTNTPTFTPSVTPSPTLTPTPKKSPTPTPTSSNTPTGSPTNTGTPPTLTPSRTPTKTTTPTKTLTPTITPTSTLQYTLTPAISCVYKSNVTHGALTYSTNSMSMTITNSTGYALAIQPISVTWNEAHGHQTGSDKTLLLKAVTLAGSSIWTNAVGVGTTPYSLSGIYTLPTGTSTITFTFHQSYDKQDGTERITLGFLTNGCQGVTVDSSN